MNDFFASIEWNSILNVDINLSLRRFYEVLHEAIQKFVPLRYFKTSTFPTWFSGELKQMVSEKKLIHREYKRGNLEAYQRFQYLRKQCKILRDACYRKYILQTVGNIASIPRYFWKFVNDKKKTYNLPSCVTYNGFSSSSSNEIVNLFSDYFSTVYDDTIVNQIPHYTHDNTVDICSYTVEIKEVIDLVLTLPYKLSYGPDGIPLHLIKNCIFTLAKPIHSLFNLSLQRGIFPKSWKHSFITPIHKSRSRDNVTNYRGICNQSELPKMLDCLISKKLSWDLKNIVISGQHGFCRGRYWVLPQEPP